MAKPKVIIGNEEWCAFPTLGVPAIKARVDSGAKTSALHAFNIQRYQYENAPWVSFELHPLPNNRHIVVQCKARVCDRRWVKSSSGLSEKRYVIKVPMQLGDFLWDVEVTLTNRDSMGYRMLLGRNAMQDHVLVDPSAGCYLGNPGLESIEVLYSNTQPVPKGLNIAILSSGTQGYGNQRLIEAVQERGHQITLIDINQCSLQFTRQEAQCYQGDQLLQHFDVVIPRFSSAVSPYACSLLQHLQQQGAYAVNSAQAIRQARDNISTLQIMQQAQVPVLLHGFATDAALARQVIWQAGGAPVLIQCLHDDRDKPHVLAKTVSSAEAIIHAVHNKGAAIMVQEYSKLTHPRIIRCLVINDKVLAAVEKPLKISGQRTSKSQSKLVEVSLTEAEYDVVIRAAQVMNLSLAGVDIIRTESGTLFFGITPNPGFEDIENTVDANIAQYLMRSLEEKFQHKVAHHE